LANRRLRRCGEIISQIALRPALARFERMVKERMSLISTKDKPYSFPNDQSSAFNFCFKHFFRSNQLSAILDQTNPLSELDLLRRVTVVGVGGLTRERAAFSIRDVHSSLNTVVFVPFVLLKVQTLVWSLILALYAKVDKYGFIEAPFRKVEKMG
jgi:DNA-directed RNA polymerase subunit beta